MGRRPLVWILAAAGLLAPPVVLSIFSLEQLRLQRAQEQRSLSQARDSHLRFAERSLDRQFSARLRRYLETADEILSSPPGRRHAELFAEPWVIHPFRLDADGNVDFPREDPPGPDEPVPSHWQRRLDEAAALEAGGDPEEAMALYRKCLERSGHPATARAAALRLGAIHFRRGIWDLAEEAYEVGWLVRRRPLDEASLEIGLSRAVCKARRGDANRWAAALNEWLEAILSRGIPPDGPVRAALARSAAERPASPAEVTLEGRMEGLRALIARLEARAPLRRALEGWGASGLRRRASGDPLLVVWRADPAGAEAAAFLRREGGGWTGALLSVPRIGAWFEDEVSREERRGLRLLPSASAGSGGPSLVFPQRLPLWRLELSGPGDAAAQGADRTAVAGEVLVGSALAASIASFAVLAWAIRRERELSRMKDRFVSEASHELRTPLAVIQTAAETLEMGRAKDPGKSREYQSLIAREARRLSRLVEGLLDFSRADAGRRPHRPQRIETGPFLRALADELSRIHERAGVRWEIDIPEDLPPLAADADALRAAVANLVDNAVKFSPEEKRVSIRARAERGGVAIEVEDRGIGIPVAERKRLFERFWRSEEAERRAIPGSGIGLALALESVRAHGGTLEALDASPRGTVFRIRLPRGAAAPAGGGP